MRLERNHPEAGMLKRLSILCVEDDASVRATLAGILRRRFKSVFVASNGQEGLEVFSACNPDMVLSDIRMPVQDGLDMSGRIKRQSASTPIVLATAFSDPRHFQRAIDIGIDRFLVKPIDGDALIEALIHCAKLLQAEEQRRLFENVFRSSFNAICVLDGEKAIRSINPAFTEITGHEEHEIVGKKPTILTANRHGRKFYQTLWNVVNAMGGWTGEIWGRRKNGEIYPAWVSIGVNRNQSEQTTGYVVVFSDIKAAHEANETIRRLAHYDALTKLPNRTLLLDRLEQALTHAQRNRSALALLFADLDRFKFVNDTLGHDAGDMLLQEVAARLKACMRSNDTVSRQGGDEFVMLLPVIAAKKDAAIVAKKAIAALNAPFFIHGQELHIGASIGIGCFPDDGRDQQTLLKNADIAMYRAKELGRNTYRFYSADMTAQATERLTLEAELHRALAHGQLVIHYQPQYNIAHGITGMGALLRWNHPTRGMLLPTDFIPVAEESDLILAIDQWVLRNACQFACELNRQFSKRLRLAVNISAKQFWDEAFIAKIRSILEQTMLPSSCLEVDVAERVFMYRSEQNLFILEKLKRMGLRVAIDNFGTAYSSLAHLRQLPIDSLKIDGSVIRNLASSVENSAFVDAIISMGKSLSIEIIAEGVETEGQEAFLRERQCQELVGNFLSRPVAPPVLRQMLSTATVTGLTQGE